MNDLQRLRRRLDRPSDQGYTLIEVLVVVAIVAALAAIAAPSWFSFMNQRRIGAVQSDLVGELNRLQRQAQQQRIYQTVWFDVDETVPTIRYGGENVDNIEDLTAQTLGAETLPQDVQLLQLEVSYANGGAWQLADSADGGPCDAAEKPCFQFNYRGVVTDPDAEILPEQNAGNPPRDRVPFKVEISTVNNPDAGGRRCVILATLLGSIKTAQGNDCDAAPDTWNESPDADG